MDNLKTLPDRAYQNAKLIFGTMFLAYALKSAEVLVAGMDPVLLFWAIWAVLIVFIVNRAVLLTGMAFYILCAMVFMLGDLRTDDSAEYVRLFPSFFVLTSIFSVCLIYSSDQFSGLGRRFANPLGYGILFLIFYWVYFIGQAQFLSDNAVREFGAENYLTLSDLLSFFCLAAIAESKKSTWMMIVWFFAGLFALMMMGSRASVLLFVFAIFISRVINSDKASIKNLVKNFILPLLVLLVSVILFFTLFEESVTYRMQTFQDLGGDVSYAERNMQIDEFLDRYAGDLSCYFAPCRPPTGEYVHNILSLVQYFGILGGVIMIIGGFYLVRAWRKGWRPKLLSIFVFALCQFLFFRPWVSIVFPVLVAYVVSSLFFLYQNQIKHTQQSSKLI